MSGHATLEELESQIGDREPTPDEYALITRAAYRLDCRVTRAIFRDRLDEDGRRLVAVLHDGNVYEAPTTGEAYWAFYKAIKADTLNS